MEQLPAKFLTMLVMLPLELRELGDATPGVELVLLNLVPEEMEFRCSRSRCSSSRFFFTWYLSSTDRFRCRRPWEGTCRSPYSP